MVGAWQRNEHERRILEALWENRPLSRAQLSKTLGASPSAIGAAVRSLLDQHLVKECGVDPSGNGRPPVGLSLNGQSASVIGLDLGVWTIQAVLVSLEGEALARDTVATADGVSHQLAQLIDKTRQLIHQAGSRPVIGVGIAIPGSLDPASHSILTCPNLPGWEGIGLGQLIAQATSLPVYVDNDANCGALGELWFGVGRTRRSLCYVLVDAGVGLGLVINREIVGIGELGHITVVPDGPPCSCGNRGCLERLASATVLEDLLRTSDTSRTYEQLACYLGIGIAAVVNLIGPDTEVLGGHLLDRHAELWPLIVKEAKARSLPFLSQRARFTPTSLGRYAPALGAASNVFNDLFKHVVPIPEGRPASAVRQAWTSFG